MDKSVKIFNILKQTKLLATSYYKLTNKSLGVTGEIAEFEAAEKLGLELCAARTAGYDAVDHNGERIQIKGRRSNDLTGRLGKIDLKKEFDSVLLVLLDDYYDVKRMFKADRAAVEIEIIKPGSKSRNERGQISISKFKKISKEIWPK
jgi:hypothetical protein